MRPAWIALAVLMSCMIGYIGIHLYLGRRRFYRTNSAGVEGFKSYGSAVRSRIFEAFLTLMTLVCLLVGFGAFVLVMGAPRHYW